MSELKEKLDKIKEAVNKIYDLQTLHGNISNAINNIIEEAKKNFNDYYQGESDKITFKDTKLENIKTSYKTLIKKIDDSITNYPGENENKEHNIEQLNSLKYDLENGENTFTINGKYTDIINNFVREEFTAFANSVTDYSISSEYEEMKNTPIFDGLYNNLGNLDLSNCFIKDNTSVLGYAYGFNAAKNVENIYTNDKITGVKLDGNKINLSGIEKVTKFSDLKNVNNISFSYLLRTYYAIYKKIIPNEKTNLDETITEFNSIITNLQEIKKIYDKKEEEVKEYGVVLTANNEGETYDFTKYFDEQYKTIFQNNTDINPEHYEKLKEYVLEIKNEIDLDSYLFDKQKDTIFNEKIILDEKGIIKAYDREGKEETISDTDTAFSFLDNIKNLFKFDDNGKTKVKSIYDLRKKVFISKGIYGYDTETKSFNKDLFLKEIKDQSKEPIYKYVKQALGVNQN